METLELRRDHSKNKRWKFIYEVVKKGKVIASRRSNKEFDTCFLIAGKISIEDKRYQEAEAICITFNSLVKTVEPHASSKKNSNS